jgi:hypothetical protein
VETSIEIAKTEAADIQKMMVELAVRYNRMIEILHAEKSEKNVLILTKKN